MAEIVGGFLVPHDHLIFQATEASPPAQKSAVLGAFTKVAERIGELRATTAIIMGSDHYILFGPGCLPSMLIGTAQVDGPLERLQGLERRDIPPNQPLAQHLFEAGRKAGFDWAVAKAITVDHSIAIPYRLCVSPNPDTKMIPIYLNSGVEPMISLARARALGALLRQAVHDWRADERIVVIGSGGISHWVGTAEMGKINCDFDRNILHLVETGDIDALVELTDRDLMKQGGNGAFEIRNFVCAMAAVGPLRGRTIAYEPVPAWITGLGFAELRARP